MILFIISLSLYIINAQDVSHVKYVHFISSCHLDLGFADSSLGIVNRYFDHHFPYAIQVAAGLAENYGIPNWNFMFQSWVVYLYLHCPENDWGFHCPSPEQKSKFEDAIRDGVISWHAFPHNAELETMNPLFIQEGIRLTHILDKEYGLSPKQTLSQRDVPGMTRSIIPLLKQMGVTSVAVGVNGASAAPSVPRVFKWQDKTSNQEIVGMWHPFGYGGNGIKDAVIFDDFEHALIPSWQGDNHGPGPASFYNHTMFDLAHRLFPNAQVFPSTYDNFTQHLLKIQDRLPVVTSEIGDTWIFGIQSDPVKVAKMNAMNRVWAQYDGDRTDSAYLNATFWALKNGEHTWGRDVKSNLKDNANWTNADFHAAKNAFVRGYHKLEESWIEEREWGITRPLDILSSAGNPLADMLKNEYAQMNAIRPSLPDSVPNAGSPMKFGGFTVQLNPDTGAIASMKLNGDDWISNDVFALAYRIYNHSDYQNFFDEYFMKKPPPSYAPIDFGKVNETNIAGMVYTPSLTKAWRSDSSLLLQLDFPSEVSKEYGGAKETYLQFDFGDSGFNVTATFLNKTSTRLPESMHLLMHSSPQAEYRFQKLGEWVDPLDVVERGAKRLHALSAMSQTSSGKRFVVEYIDSALAALGAPDAFPTPLDKTPDVKSYGANAILWDNLWGTNYVMWYPFANISADLKFRFTVSLVKD